MNRRMFLASSVASGVAAAMKLSAAELGPARPSRTRFQLACMTLPYSSFPWQRALRGIRGAGFDYVAWGTTHRESGGESTPILAPDAPPQQARQLAQQCRDLGLEPVMMFSMIYPEAPHALEVLTQRIEQAAAARIPQLLTFGHTQGGNRALWIDRLKKLGPVARDQGVCLVVKQHGGETGTGRACADIVREVDDDGIRVNYDAGNVMDYLNVDPIPDIAHCAAYVRSFCMKDHRNWPKDEDCAPGLGEIDHYRLLFAVLGNGGDMPLCCENIFTPLVARPSTPEGVDACARRTREYLQLVLQGLEQVPPG